MSQQDLDLRSSMKAVRRHRKLFAALVVLGILIGAAVAVLRPPTQTSAALVVLQQTNTAQNNTSSPADALAGEIGTQVVIADSYPVLAGAVGHVSPATTVQQLGGRVTVASVAGSIISISATGSTAAEAETAANAVANSYISYVGAADSPVKDMSAKMLQTASTATGTQRLPQLVTYVLLGGAGGALVGLAVTLALSRKDRRRLVTRDAIAGSIGSPVLASVPVARPSGAPAWSKLLAEYQPAPVDAWGLTRLLHVLAVGGPEVGETADPPEPVTVTVVSLSCDPGALALGPQLAAFAAGQGVPTALVVGPQQDMDTVAALRTACAAPPQQSQHSPESRESRESRDESAGSATPRSRPLHLIVCDDDKLGDSDAALVVVVTVVDGQAPAMPRTVPTDTTVLGVSAGAASADQLARAAVAAAADGREITGILVADPDAGDQSSGRVTRIAVPWRQPPTRVHDVPTEIR